MAQVLFCDVIAVARALHFVSQAERPALLARIFLNARRAQAYRRLEGRGHPVWGDGSVQSALGDLPLAREPFLDDSLNGADFTACLQMVLKAVLARVFVATILG